MTVLFEIKVRFLQLASDLSPENLHCDGEISAAAAERKRKAIMTEWAGLERHCGRKIDETEVWTWVDEVRQVKQTAREKANAAEPQNSIVRHGPNPGTWYRDGKTGSSAYYIWGPQHQGTTYQLFSELAYRVVGNREKIGEYATLDEAVAAGEAFLATVTYEATAKNNPLWKPEIIKRELERLPEGFDAKIPAMPPVTGFRIRVGEQIIGDGVAADDVAAILIQSLVERGQHATVEAVG